MYRVKEELKRKYIEFCDSYLQEFCKKHEIEKGEWIANDIGGFAECGDYFVSLADMILDIEKNLSPEEYRNYYDYCLLSLEFGFGCISFKDWLNEVPRVENKTFDKLMKLKNEIINTVLEEKK